MTSQKLTQHFLYEKNTNPNWLIFADVKLIYSLNFEIFLTLKNDLGFYQEFKQLVLAKTVYKKEWHERVT